MKINLELDNYPELQHLFQEDKEYFSHVLKNTMMHTNDALKENRIQTAKDVYKMDYFQMVDDVMDTFFDTDGIAEQHHNNAEAEGLKSLGISLHPLSIFTDNSPIYNTKGDNISPKKWIEQDDFDLKNWLYALFYGARFVSWKELADYLSLGKFDLIDVLKTRNFEQLS